MLSRNKKILLGALSALCVFIVGLITGEITLRLASPTEYLHPRYKHSPEYGLLPFENSVMVHGVPGKFKFSYTINSLGYRGKEVTSGLGESVPRIVVLGDSYAFGMGVNDGEEFPAVLDRTLGDKGAVINIASPGWGLTQQIRRFYEFGLDYDPAVVVLQFCANDPADNFVYNVTRIENGEFVYQDSHNKFSWVKKYLSKSVIQRSQLYNFFRSRAYRLVEQKLIKKQESRFKSEAMKDSDDITPQEELYRNLLELFVSKLNETGMPLVMISVDNQLDEFPFIKEKVLELDGRGTFRYVEVTEWLEETSNYSSVEGHVWGYKAHDVIGKRLGTLFIREYL